jgi:flavorubredoxin
MTFFPFYGNGNFWMNVSGLEIFAYGALNRTNENRLEVGTIELDVTTNDIDLNFDNLMGGGAWSSLTNSLLNKMSTLIFDSVKHKMLDEVSNDIRTMINQQLDHLPLDFVDEKSSNIFDNILEYSKRAINETGLDPLLLPPFEDKFKYNLLIFVFEGKIRIFDGRLYGLSSLVRTGDIIATYNNNEVIFEARMGFANLTGGYQWAANLMGLLCLL